mmetsp:Transcript_112435/g.257495  ORF Transcript_112435/g.257495 Transcript_112435/m.257495 type:complete len:216 (-) Transcript_112435:679-1326(-)
MLKMICGHSCCLCDASDRCWCVGDEIESSSDHTALAPRWGGIIHKRHVQLGSEQDYVALSAVEQRSAQPYTEHLRPHLHPIHILEQVATAQLFQPVLVHVVHMVAQHHASAAACKNLVVHSKSYDLRCPLVVLASNTGRVNSQRIMGTGQFHFVDMERNTVDTARPSCPRLFAVQFKLVSILVSNQQCLDFQAGTAAQLRQQDQMNGTVNPHRKR